MTNQPNPGAGRVELVTAIRTRAIGWLLMGLLLGLLIGWVVWPVQWVDAEPDNLRPDARAHFISATADAYVASGGQDPNTALARMQSFADPQDAVADAIAFFQQSNDPNRAIRVVNLRSLSSALQASAMFAPAPDTTEISWGNWLLGALTGLLLLIGGGWIIRRWLISLRNAPTAGSTTPPVSQTAWVPPISPISPGAQPTPYDGGWQPSAPPEQTRAGQVDTVTQVVRPVQMETWDDPEDAPAFSSPASSPSLPTSTRPRSIPGPTDDDPPLRRVMPSKERLAPVQPDADPETNSDTNSGTNQELDDTLDSFIDFSRVSAVGEDDEEGDFDGHTRDDDWKNWQPEKELPVIRRVTPETLEEDADEDAGYDGEDDWDELLDDDLLDDDPLGDKDFEEGEWELDEEETEQSPATPSPWLGGARPAPASPALPPPDEDDDPESTVLPTVKSVLSNFGWGEKDTGTKSQDGKTIGVYIAEYNIGIMAYEQSFTITSTGGEDGTPLGACGMGISEALDKSAANSNHVRVLDVWLYDGLEVRTSSQYLVSPGLDKEALGEQAKSAGTITGEPLDIAGGVTFRIPAKNLVLDCRIVNADFLTPEKAPSPLRTVRVEMTARVAK